MKAQGPGLAAQLPEATLVAGQWSFFFFLLLIYLFIYFWLHWVFVAMHGFPLVVASGGYSSLRCAGFSPWWLLFVAEHGL